MRPGRGHPIGGSARPRRLRSPRPGTGAAMHALMGWTLGGVGYFWALWMILRYTHRVETALDEDRGMTVGVLRGPGR